MDGSHGCSSWWLLPVVVAKLPLPAQRQLMQMQELPHSALSQVLLRLGRLQLCLQVRPALYLFNTHARALKDL